MALSHEYRRRFEFIVTSLRQQVSMAVFADLMSRDALAAIAVEDHVKDCEALLGKLDSFISMLQERGVVGGHEVVPLRNQIATLLDKGD